MARVGALITPFVAQVRAATPVEPKPGTRQEMWLFMGWPCLEGDAGILRVPGSVCVLLLLPLRRHRLLRAAH